MLAVEEVLDAIGVPVAADRSAECGSAPEASYSYFSQRLVEFAELIGPPPAPPPPPPPARMARGRPVDQARFGATTGSTDSTDGSTSAQRATHRAFVLGVLGFRDAFDEAETFNRREALRLNGARLNWLENAVVIGDHNELRGRNLLVIGNNNVVRGDNNRSRGCTNKLFGRWCTNHDFGSFGVARGGNSVRYSAGRDAHRCSLALSGRSAATAADDLAEELVRGRSLDQMSARRSPPPLPPDWMVPESSCRHRRHHRHHRHRRRRRKQAK